jgi:hypothetical protein
MAADTTQFALPSRHRTSRELFDLVSAGVVVEIHGERPPILNRAVTE